MTYYADKLKVLGPQLTPPSVRRINPDGTTYLEPTAPNHNIICLCATPEIASLVASLLTAHQFSELMRLQGQESAREIPHLPHLPSQG